MQAFKSTDHRLQLTNLFICDVAIRGHHEQQRGGHGKVGTWRGRGQVFLRVVAQQSVVVFECDGFVGGLKCRWRDAKGGLHAPEHPHFDVLHQTIGLHGVAHIGQNALHILRLQ